MKRQAAHGRADVPYIDLSVNIVGVIDGLYGGKTERALTDFYNIQGC
jgi:hypothetical protein